MLHSEMKMNVLHKIGFGKRFYIIKREDISYKTVPLYNRLQFVVGMILYDHRLYSVQCVILII